MSNVLVYAPFATWQPHFVTDLELAKQAASEGDKVSLYVCNGSLPTCAPNVNHSLLVCQMCKARSYQGIKWLKNKFDVNVLSTFNLTVEESRIIDTMIRKDFTSIQEIKNLEFEECDIGMSALSSVISYLREPNPALEKYQDMIKKNIQTAMIVYFSIKKILLEGDYEKVILFNGRFSALRPALRVAKKMGVEVIVHERGTYVNEYSITKNTYPHDINYIYQKLTDIKENIPLNICKQLGNEWFKERINGQQQNWISFTEKQEIGKLPKEIQARTLKIAIFNSSEDEYEAIEEWKNPYYRTQNEGIRRILEDSKHLSIQFFLRVHPNLKGINNSQTQELISMKNKNLVFIDPSSDISTYALIENVDLIITFGSTVGIEAAHMGKPVCLMGKTPYDILDACILPKDHNDLIRLITTFSYGTSIPVTNNDAYIYGYWQKIRSIPFKYVKQTDISKACLLSDNDQKNLTESVWFFIYYILHAVDLRITRWFNKYD